MWAGGNDMEDSDKRFKVTDTRLAQTYEPQTISDIDLMFSEQWRAASAAVIAAGRLEVGDETRVCGLIIERLT
jgi:hypothetical protein